jgi:hypothetical protein
MKRLAQKFQALSLVSSETANQEVNVEERSANLKDSFDGWLSSVAPTLLQSAPAQKINDVTARWRSLSSIDVTRVNRATVRESSDHRHWPPEVVTSFLAAEVIKRTNKNH